MNEIDLFPMDILANFGTSWIAQDPCLACRMESLDKHEGEIINFYLFVISKMLKFGSETFKELYVICTIQIEMKEMLYWLYYVLLIRLWEQFWIFNFILYSFVVIENEKMGSDFHYVSRSGNVCL